MKWASIINREKSSIFFIYDEMSCTDELHDFNFTEFENISVSIMTFTDNTVEDFYKLFKKCSYIKHIAIRNWFYTEKESVHPEFKILDIVSFLSENDYKGTLRIRDVEQILDISEAMALLPKNLKKLEYYGLPSLKYDMPNTILSIYNRDGKLIPFLEKFGEKIHYLVLDNCYISSPQEFCAALLKSNIRYLEFIHCFDEIEDDPEAYIFFTGLIGKGITENFKHIFADMMHINTTLREFEIKR